MTKNDRKKVFKLLYSYIQSELSCISELSCDFRASYNKLLTEILDYRTIFTDGKILQEIDDIIEDFKKDYIDWWDDKEND